MRFAEHTTEHVPPAVSTSHTSSATVTHGGSLSSSALPQSIPTVLHVRPDDSDEHLGSKKLELSDPGDLPRNVPMSSDVNLSSGDMRVACLLERFERERVADKSWDPVSGGVSDEQFLDVAGLDGPARSRVICELLKLEQTSNETHVAEIFSEPKTMATPSRMGLQPGLIFDCHAVAGTWTFRGTLNVCVNTWKPNDQCSYLDRGCARRSWTCNT